MMRKGSKFLETTCRSHARRPKSGRKFYIIFL